MPPTRLQQKLKMITQNKDIILTKLVFPQKFADCRELYFKGENFKIENNKILCHKGDKFSTESYFNSFTYSKWAGFTKINDVYLNIISQGEYFITIKATYIQNDELQTVKIAELNVKENNFTYLIPDSYKDSVISWEITAISDNLTISDAFYTTKLMPGTLNKVSFSIGICTYKREKNVSELINELQNAYFNENSVLFNKIDIHVADNGQTLDSSKFNSDCVHIYKNKNLGGSGGFTRCLIESLNSEKKYSHFIFMDDDIELNITSLELNYTFLSLLKDEYKQSCIGGALFSTDEPLMQFENGARWNNGFDFNKRGLYMDSFFNVVKNEEIVPLDYNAWCYCCIPFNAVNSNNLPLPFFLHYDDVEYGIRNKFNIITLNGINVWHPFRRELANPTDAYYNIRNRLFFMSIYQPELVKDTLKKHYRYCLNELFKYHYDTCINSAKGLIDFYKGFKFFLNKKDCGFNSKLLKNSTWTDANYDFKNYEESKGNVNINGKKKKLKLFLQQYFFNTNKKLFIYDNNGINDCINSKCIVVLNRKWNKEIVYKRNIFLFIRGCFMLYKTKMLIKIFRNNKSAYCNTINSLKTKHFWNNILK